MNMIAASLASQESAAAELALASAPPRRRWLRRLVILALAGGLLYAFRHPLMTQAAQLWIISDPLEKADAVLVLGGGLDTRPFAAAEIYQRGLAPIALIAQPELGPVVEIQLLPPEVEVTAAILHKLGVPDSAVQRFGNGVTSTRDEAVAARKWLEQHPARHLIIPTDPFHTRRVRYIFERELRGLDVQLTVTAIPSKRYDPLLWWKSEEATISFQNEIIKLVHYWLH